MNKFVHILYKSKMKNRVQIFFSSYSDFKRMVQKIKLICSGRLSLFSAIPVMAFGVATQWHNKT